MILPDLEIITLCKRGLVKPFDIDFVNPASLDIRLGLNVLIESEKSACFVDHSIAECSKERPFMLQPHQFILADTLEQFDLPDCIAAQLALKSSRAREGLEHLMAGYVDPGYRGRLTLELQNARQMHAIPLWPGMRIAQLVFHKMSMLPGRDYSLTGRYYDDIAVQASKG